MDLSPVDLHRMPVHPVHKDTDALHRLQKDVRIPNIRHIFNQNRLVRHYRSRKYRKRRVLRAADFHLAHQRISAANHILFHLHPYPGCDKHPSIKTQAFRVTLTGAYRGCRPEALSTPPVSPSGQLP